MILTEKEAQKKWCPMSKPDFVSDCRASGCMAWRRATDPDGHPVMKQVAPPSDCQECKGKGSVPEDTDKELFPCPECDGEGKVGHYERMGFCGLAGKP